MKVMLIDVNCKNSSTGKLVYDLYTELLKNGDEAYICYGRGPIVSEKNIYKISNSIEICFNALLTRVTGLTGYFSFLSTLRILELIKKIKPDVIHIHDPKTYYLNIGMLIKYFAKKKIKSIWTLHSEFLYTGKCGHSLDCERWKASCGQCPQVREYPTSLFFDRTHKMINDKRKWFSQYQNVEIVAVSAWLTLRASNSFLKEKRIHTVYNGIDTNNIFYWKENEDLRKRLKLGDNKIVLAIAPGLMSDFKGGKWVLELAKRFEMENVVFIMIGAKRADEIHGKNIIALPRINDQIELAKYYSLANITLITSKRETFSLICAESLACGTPIIGFEAGAPTEIAPEGYGAFVEYGDLNSLEETLRNVISGDKKLASAEACRRFSEEHYSKQIMFNNYRKIYTDIIQEALAKETL